MLKNIQIFGCLICYLAVSLMSVKNGNWYSFYLNPSLCTAKADQSDTVEFYSVSIAPAKVAAGDMIHIQAVFSVISDSNQNRLPVHYFYEIQQQNETVFRSSEKTMQADTGSKSVLNVQVKAAGGYGDYKLVLKLNLPKGTAFAESEFSIVSPEEAHAYAIRAGLLQDGPPSRKSADDSLLGKWRLAGSTLGIPSAELTIGKENGKLVAGISRENTVTHWVKLRKTANRLVLRSKSENSVDNCWYVMEDVITFNESTDNMPVRSRIIDGGQCVTIGLVLESTLYRID